MKMNSKVSLCTRRKAMAMGGLALAGGLPGLARAQGDRIKLAQSGILTGPVAALGLPMIEGSKIAFAAINAAGGVNGRKIDLDIKDDAYDVKQELANVTGFLADPSVFALYNCGGTPHNVAFLPKVIESGIPYLAPFTGALAVHPKVRNVLNVRATYATEAERMVTHLYTLGHKAIGIVYHDNGFGKEVFDSASATLDGLKLKPTGAAAVATDGANAATAVESVLKTQPRAVLVLMTGKAAVDSIKAVRTQSPGTLVYTLSVMGSASSIASLGPAGVGVVMSQVVPLPYSQSLAIVRDFNRDLAASGSKMEPSHVMLEGYINARVFALIAQRAGAKLTRESFLNAAWGLKAHDLGGFPIAFTDLGKSASNFVELTMIRKDGKFAR